MWVRSLDKSQRVNTVMCGQSESMYLCQFGLRWEVLDTADGATVLDRACAAFGRRKILHASAARWQASTIFAT